MEEGSYDTDQRVWARVWCVLRDKAAVVVFLGVFRRCVRVSAGRLLCRLFRARCDAATRPGPHSCCVAPARNGMAVACRRMKDDWLYWLFSFGESWIVNLAGNRRRRSVEALGQVWGVQRCIFEKQGVAAANETREDQFTYGPSYRLHVGQMH